MALTLFLWWPCFCLGPNFLAEKSLCLMLSMPISCASDYIFIFTCKTSYSEEINVLGVFRFSFKASISACWAATIVLRWWISSWLFVIGTECCFLFCYYAFNSLFHSFLHRGCQFNRAKKLQHVIFGERFRLCIFVVVADLVLDDAMLILVWIPACQTCTNVAVFLLISQWQLR